MSTYYGFIFVKYRRKEIKVNTNNNMSKDEMHSKEIRSAKLKIFAFDGNSINSFVSPYFQATSCQTNYKLSQILEGEVILTPKLLILIYKLKVKEVIQLI